MKAATLPVALAVLLAGCNIVPPLDCLAGVQRPGCQRDANGEYHYLYTSPLVTAPNSDAVPVGYPPPEVVYVSPPAAPPVYIPPVVPITQTRPILVATPAPAANSYLPTPAPPPPYQQPVVAVSPGGSPVGVVVPMGGGNNVVVSPDGQPIGVTQ